MSIIHANPPSELIALPQWVLWRYEAREGKRTKVPTSTMGYRASSTNADHWSTFENAIKAASRPGFADGIGFVFSAEDPYCGIDLDGVWQSDADEGGEWAQGILDRFADTYMEESPSGKGIKLWVRAKPSRCGKWPVGAGAIEVYDHARFFTVTGRGNGVGVVSDHHDDVSDLVAHLDEDRRREPAHVIAGPISQGKRHNTLVSLAGTMWRRGMEVDAIEAALMVTNERRCDPPYSADHIHKIVASVQGWTR